MTKQTRSRSTAITAIAMAVSLIGCNAAKDADSLNKATNSTANTTINQATTFRNDLARPTPGNVQVHDDVWLGTNKKNPRRGEPLPPRLQSPTAILAVGERPMTLQLLMQEIYAITNIRTAFQTNAGALDQGAARQLEQERNNINMWLDFEGPLSDLLDQISARFNVYWDYRNGELRFYDLDSRVFEIVSQPNKTNIKTTFDQSNSQISSGAQGTSVAVQPPQRQQVTTETRIDIWPDIKENIEALIGKTGRVAVAPSTGSITVVAPPAQMEQVARFIDRQNELRSRQAKFNITAITVRLTKRDEYGLDLGLIFEQHGLRFANASPTTSFTSGFGTTSLGVVSSNQRILRKFNGTDIVLSALSSLGDITKKIDVPFTAINDQPVAQIVGTQTTYLASVSAVTTASVGTSLAPQPGTVTSGVIMNALARILDSNRILLQYGLALNELQRLNTITTGSGATATSIQAPELATQNFSNQIILGSGDTLILAGFQQVQGSREEQGTFWPSFMGLGGSDKSLVAREITVVLITPEILQLPSRAPEGSESP